MPVTSKPTALRPPRAASLPPAERRQAIIEATLPLLLEQSSAVTTRQIAEAAGIAEGTIFRVFPDKDAVIRAAVEHAFDPAPSEAALAAIDRTLPFDAQLVEAVEVMQRRLSVIWRLLGSLGAAVTPPARPTHIPALTALFEPEAARLRREPARAAEQLRALTLAVSHPALVDEPMSPAEIVSLLLDGIRVRSGGQEGGV